MFALPNCQEPGEDVEDRVGVRVPTLEVGDAVIWTRETAGRTANGQGGYIHVVVFSSKES